MEMMFILCIEFLPGMNISGELMFQELDDFLILMQMNGIVLFDVVSFLIALELTPSEVVDVLGL